jgi:peptidyl-prolyl cis-trans isomerase SurA
MKPKLNLPVDEPFMKKNHIINMARIILLIILTLPSLSLAAESIEGIIAIVGNEPIMISELAAQMQLLAIQRGLKPETQEEIDLFQQEVLDQMISERLFLAEARKDSMIRVSDEEVMQTLDEHIAKTASQFPTEEQFLQQLAAEGLTLRTFKKNLKPEIRNQLLKQRLVASKLSSISVSRQEVFEFYEEYQDSIPIQPQAIRLAHILVTFQPSGGTEDSVLKYAEEVRSNVAGGADFASVAATYSAGPSALSGGDLGFIARSDVVDEFGRVAFNLSPGDISGPVRTQYGYHIIKCEEIKGKKAHLRHILFMVNPTAADSALSYFLVDSLVNEIRAGTDFKELAKIFSADDESRRQGGELGWFAVADLPPGFQVALDKLPEIGDVYGPAHSEYGLHILKKLDWRDEKRLNPDDDFDQIRDIARQLKTTDFVDQWIREIKERTYVEIRPIQK